MTCKKHGTPGISCGWCEDQSELRAARAEIDRLRKEVHNLNWALGMPGYEQMATPDDQAEHEAGNARVDAMLTRMEENKRKHDAMEKDAERYRWLRAQVSGHRTLGSARPACFAFPTAMGLPPLADIMRGSVAQHLDAAIDDQMRRRAAAVGAA